MTIRRRLLLLVLGTALLPALLVGGRYYQDRGKEIEAAIGSLAATARSVASNLDAKVQATAQLNFGLSRARDLAERDKAACSNFLAEVLEKNPQFTGLLTVEPDGSLFCDSLRTGRQLDLRDRNYFKQALAGRSVAIEPVFGRLTGSAVLQIAHPAYDEGGRLRFILLASLDLDRLMKEQVENLPHGLEVLLADARGTVLTWSAAQRWTGRPGASIANSELFRFAAENPSGTRELAGHEGETQVWAVADTLGFGGVKLHILVGRAKSELVAAPNRRLVQDLATLGVLSALLFAGVWLLAEFAIRLQISRIVKMAERLGAGDLGARILPPFPKGELGGLMTVLNGTAASLERQKQDIEDLNLKLSQSQRLEAQERQRLDVAINNIPHGLLLYDATNRLVVCNQRYIEMYGLSPDVAKPGCSFYDLIRHRRETGSFVGSVEEYCSGILRNVARGEVTRMVVEAADGRSIQVINQPLAGGGWIATMEDITERKRSDARIEHMAHYDALTDLPNRILFHERLEAALRTIAHGEQLAVLYIDIDEFKRINDSLGHSIGDELLKAVARRLRGCLADTDLVARLGGDEFAIIQTAIRRPADIMNLVAQIYQAIREPFECVGHLLTTDASIGIAMAGQDCTDLDQLLKNADLAMYEAKADGRRTHRFFEPGMEARVNLLRTLELDLRQAITGGGLEIHYQPLVSVGNDRVTGCEALLRWRHPQRGMISPAEFIPVAEDTGMIDALGEWVLGAACAEAATWPDQMKVAVNVSPVQFRSQGFALKVATALAASGLPAHRLELEITEAVLIRDDEAALAMLNQLHELGVRIALDDFGTGYSSLSYLQRFPFDKIKIDRSFIKDVADHEGSASIVQAVVNIAATRRMTTTAEGVETGQQLDKLRELGCTEMQGYLFSPALPAADIHRLLRSRGQSLAGAA